jgi:hypothetical protein
VSEDYDDYEPESEEVPEQPRDPVTDDAKQAIVARVAEEPGRVYYSRQLEVLHEKKFFHWITNRAVRELVDERVFRVEAVDLGPNVSIKFLVPKGLRYHQRAVKKMARVVRKYSDHEFAKAMGLQAETLFLNGFALRGFVARGRDVREYRGVKWTTTNHNLDFVIERDGIAYGVEVKNTLDYIPRNELRTKVAMCDAFGITPLMIMRWAPKSYIYDEIMRAASGSVKGFALLFEKQVYPYGWESLVAEVVNQLGLPVHSPRAIPDGDIDRFVNWHARRVKAGLGVGSP